MTAPTKLSAAQNLRTLRQTTTKTLRPPTNHSIGRPGLRPVRPTGEPNGPRRMPLRPRRRKRRHPPPPRHPDVTNPEPSTSVIPHPPTQTAIAHLAMEAAVGHMAVSAEAGRVAVGAAVGRLVVCGVACRLVVRAVVTRWAAACGFGRRDVGAAVGSRVAGVVVGGLATEIAAGRVVARGLVALGEGAGMADLGAGVGGGRVEEFGAADEGKGGQQRCCDPASVCPHCRAPPDSRPYRARPLSILTRCNRPRQGGKSP